MRIALTNAACPEQKFNISQLPATIGRQPRAAVRLDDRRVSHFQCVIDAQDGLLTVLDLGSISGTYVNGVRRAMATLLHGDRLTARRDRFRRTNRLNGRNGAGGHFTPSAPCSGLDHNLANCCHC